MPLKVFENKFLQKPRLKYREVPEKNATNFTFIAFEGPWKKHFFVENTKLKALKILQILF